MRYTTYIDHGEPRLGVVHNNEVIDLNRAQPHISADLRAALKSGQNLDAAAKAAIASAAPRRKLEDLELAPLLPEPGKIVCLGLNYYDHAKEGGREKPVYPWFFLRCATSLLAHGKAALRPKVSERLDWEAELAVVIGKTAKHCTMENALDAVFGYTVFNDISVRDYQKKTPQWTIGKNFDRTGPLGPTLITADELPPGAVDLRIQARLNGQVMQDANTREMIWGVAETIQLLSECMTLEPGDLIVMGTPAGVGQARTPPVWMKHGDKIEIEIERVGLLRNTIEDEAA
ncbi:5-oxopent-3-ene-1,2,5-tricarboxylate decarboxylase [Hylemonella gracilis str. Niagara R]|uniref:5-oxopent-3-ene-1,2,5-tricarboxylate decarboxylase n=1 Tax=Hylemonella gracilis str. Niagara R TaxID=1458275 RepID=A0A016XL55_9BURK|nr:fumarylacetoacetate hydrolase family protein [Hylemonella gracilis]EYC52317.1 5-oxopent-3-ene-1,2,5-tricarboxylate decarboxylase [Hylemonella gracilis str. Niagara R]